jgi:hypothetical protein
MTNEQRTWLVAHPAHEAVGTGRIYSQTGWLRTDGTFIPDRPGSRPSGVLVGAFRVGIRKVPSDHFPQGPSR